MKIISILSPVLFIIFFNSCATSNKNVKSTKPIVVQEMNDDNVIILSDLAPNDLRSFLSYVRQKIYINLRTYIYTRKNKIEGTVNVKFMILSTGHVKILKLSGTKKLYPASNNIVKKSFPVPVFINVYLPMKINITLDYTLNNANPPNN